MGAIAIVRLSGKGSIALADTVFISPSGNRLAEAPANTVHFGRIQSDGEVLDEVLVTVFHAPHSFTGEDSVEISCHGSIYIQQKIVELLFSKGARMALAGEFTRRAFRNGKFDLSQAEAVADLISSTSRASHRVAMNQMRGGFAQKLADLRDKLLQFVSLIELELDFQRRMLSLPTVISFMSSPKRLKGKSIGWPALSSLVTLSRAVSPLQSSGGDQCRQIYPAQFAA